MGCLGPSMSLDDFFGHFFFFSLLLLFQYDTGNISYGVTFQVSKKIAGTVLSIQIFKEYDTQGVMLHCLFPFPPDIILESRAAYRTASERHVHKSSYALASSFLLPNSWILQLSVGKLALNIPIHFSQICYLGRYCFLSSHCLCQDFDKYYFEAERSRTDSSAPCLEKF